jgi:hypothetical protein
MIEDDPFVTIQGMLPISTELPFEITGMTVAVGSIDLVGTLSFPYLHGPSQAIPTTNVRFTVQHVGEQSWQIVAVAVTDSD